MRVRGQRRSRQRVSRALVVVAAALLLGSCTGGDDDPTPDDPPEVGGSAVIDEFAEAWSNARRPDFRGVVDEPELAKADVAAHVAELSITDTRARPLDELDCDSDSCTGQLEITHELSGIGEWSYQTQVEAEEQQGQWLVTWTAGTFHPDLTESTTLVISRRMPARAPILDRNGKALTPERAIVRIGVVAGDVRSSTYSELERLIEVDVNELRNRVRAADPNWFVPVIDLREATYQPLRTELELVPGISVDTGQRALAPTSEWGRAILGTVGPATAETLEEAGPLFLPTDEVGLSGLQRSFQPQLSGAPGVAINLVEKSSPGTVLNTVFTRRAIAGTPLETSLDLDAQTAAERAVGNARDTTAVVVVKASTGEVLAAANAPGPTSYNTAFIGRYPPGSTFKVVSAATLLREQVVTPRTSVSCPDTTVVDGKRFKNYDVGIVPGRADFSDAFAASCNTTFVSLADDIDGSDLAGQARQFGFGAEWELGLPAYSGSVPSDADLVTRAADMIGQGKVLASPLMMAMVAAAVDSGVSRTPTLLPDQQPGRRLDELDPDQIATLQGLMRKVVTSGTASALNLSGLPIHAKSGTAEYQDGNRVRTHAWMIGYRGDLAFAVLVENGQSGADDAGPVVTSVLSEIPDRLYR